MNEDEKVMLSTNALNSAFQKQVVKRETAPLVSDEAAGSHVNAVIAASATASTSGLDGFFAAWDKYYPTIVSLLGWASWVLPPKAINIIKALLAIINNELIPWAKQALG